MSQRVTKKFIDYSEYKDRKRQQTERDNNIAISMKEF